jgi:phosphoribosylamine---glycine ligase
MAQVQVIMGSASDKDAVVAAGIVGILDAVGVSYALSVCSAHRNLPELDTFVKQTLEEGAQVFIGVAGMAAALPGALAGCTKMAKPILAVPLDEHGIDSCIYMPPGVPVLTTGVGKAGLKNAAIAACQILGVGDQKIEAALKSYIQKNNKQPQLNLNLEGTN